MGVHEDTLQGLQEALDYVKGDKTKARSHTVTIPDEDYNIKINQLPKEKQEVIRIIIDDMLKASNH